jgi:hypothetical protein
MPAPEDLSPEELDREIARLTQEVEELKAQGRAMGIFVEDRPLLECLKCGLLEDLSDEGLLLTYHRQEGEVQPDTGLRFEQVEPGHFRCPACKNLLILDQQEPEA